jgi:hypothetical protein
MMFISRCQRACAQHQAIVLPRDKPQHPHSCNRAEEGSMCS